MNSAIKEKDFQITSMADELASSQDAISKLVLQTSSDKTDMNDKMREAKDSFVFERIKMEAETTRVRNDLKDTESKLETSIRKNEILENDNSKLANSVVNLDHELQGTRVKYVEQVQKLEKENLLLMQELKEKQQRENTKRAIEESLERVKNADNSDSLVKQLKNSQQEYQEQVQLLKNKIESQTAEISELYEKIQTLQRYDCNMPLILKRQNCAFP